MTLKPEVNLRDCVVMTTKPDMETKKRAEKALDEISRNDGFLTGLLHLSSKDEEPSVRLLSALYFRRYLEKFWQIDGFDKETIIKEFPFILLSASKEGEKQLMVTLQYILKSEEVEKCEPLLKKVEEFIKSSEKSVVMIGLKMLNKVIISFIEDYKEEKHFECILDNVGVDIMNIIVAAIKEGNGELAAFGMKVLGHSCESYILPNVFKDHMFLQNVITVIEMCINTLYENVSTVKWSFRLLNGLLKKTKKKKTVPAFELFTRPDVLALLYRKTIDILSLYTRTGASPTVEAISFELIRNIMSKSVGWDIIRNDTPMITTRFILPAVSFTEELEESWESSQIDFMRECEARYTKNASTTASDLFLEIAKKNSNTPEALAYLVNAIIGEISGYTVNPTPELIRLRFGGLSLFKIAGKYIHSNQDVFNIVMNDIKAPHSIIQYISFSTLQYLSYYRAIPASVLDAFSAAVRSKDIGVVVESILCLPHLLTDPVICERLKGTIPGFIKLLLDLSNKIQIEALAIALEDVIMQCPEEAREIAPAISEAICTSVIQLMKQSVEEKEEEPEERYEVIDGYIRTIITLIESLEKAPESMQAMMVPIKRMVLIVGTNYPDFFPDLFSLLVSCSYCLKSVDGMYEIFELILKMPMDDLVIYINELSSVFDNFITYGKENMVKYIEPIFSILSEMMQDAITDYDFPYLCRIIESILLNMPQALGDKLSGFIKAAISLVLSDKEMITAVGSLISAVEIVLCSAILMPGETLAHLQKTNSLTFIMSSLESTYKKFERVHDLKLLLLFTGVLFSQPENTLPPQISVEQLMKIFIFVIEAFPGALSRREALKNSGEDDDYNQEGDSEYGDSQCFDEDPSFETPLDAINPFDYAKNICSLGQGTVIASAWRALPESDRQKIIALIQQK
ncbi:importin-7 [Nematocida ausubeli]|nr:importin-7 [Nematocida ausubeli]